MDLGLKDRRALVTGASKGLGRACAQALADEGARVFISSRNAAAIEAAGKAVKAAGWAAADVSKEGEVESLVDQAVQALGGLDILVANAGGPPPGTFQTTSVEAWEPAFHLTLMSAVRLVKASLPALKESGQGRVVFITSISVRQPIPTLVLSNALRAAVTGLAKTLSREVAADGITVNCIAPDAILTDRLRELNLKVANTPMGRFGDPAEIAAACAFLCSKHAGYITGQTLGVDGGSLLGVH
jgi:3-oxoacyl-[acyl-carrier protein] reductase